MAWQTSKRVWDKAPSTVTKNDRLMLLALAECADEFGVCWPGYDRLAGMVGVDPRSAMRLIQHLETQKQIIILKQSGKNGGRGYTNLYLIVTGLGQDDIKRILETHPMFTDKGDKIYTLLPLEKGDNLSQKGDNLSQKGDKNNEKGDIAMSPEPCKPSIEPSIEPSFTPEEKRSAEKPKPGRARPPKSPAYQVYVEKTEYYAITKEWIEKMTSIIGDKPESLERWGETITCFTGKGKWKGNVEGMLDWFQNGIPAYYQSGDKTNGHQRTNKTGTYGRTVKSRALGEDTIRAVEDEIAELEQELGITGGNPAGASP
jgi:hypothetical protein